NDAATGAVRLKSGLEMRIGRQEVFREIGRVAVNGAESTGYFTQGHANVACRQFGQVRGGHIGEGQVFPFLRSAFALSRPTEQDRRAEDCEQFRNRITHSSSSIPWNPFRLFVTAKRRPSNFPASSFSRS